MPLWLALALPLFVFFVYCYFGLYIIIQYYKMQDSWPLRMAAKRLAFSPVKHFPSANLSIGAGTNYLKLLLVLPPWTLFSQDWFGPVTVCARGP